jgi:hypothetical protein
MLQIYDMYVALHCNYKMVIKVMHANAVRTGNRHQLQYAYRPTMSKINEHVQFPNIDCQPHGTRDARGSLVSLKRKLYLLSLGWLIENRMEKKEAN